MDPDIWSCTLILVFLIIFNSFIALSQTAIVELNDVKLKKAADDGNKTAIKLLKLTDEPSKFMSTVEIVLRFTSFFAAVLAANSFSYPMIAFLDKYIANLYAIKVISYVFITLVLTFILILFGELVPKRIAKEYPEQIAFWSAGIIYAVSKFFTPFSKLLIFTSKLMVSLIGISSEHSSEQVTEEEIRMIVDVGEESGVIEQNEKVMINNVLEFDDTTAGEIMTHRTDIIAVRKDAGIDEVVSLSIKEGYSRIPVYEEDIDDIVGLLYIKDLLCFIVEGKKEEFEAKKFMRSVLYIPESMSCTDIFALFKEKKIQMAVVVDEYGGTSGIVTMEDLLESIVGNIQDEYDNEVDEIFKVSDNVYTLDGSVSVDEIEELFGISIEGQHNEYDTLGGLITQMLDRIPMPDEKPSVRIGNVLFTVLLVSGRRIQRVKAEILPEKQDA
ncbi:MAG TPA: HlyC/CorC family transporter [Ruminococcaceae bacterium]|nr:HlyC/CorC family transporter [Oscillospiraceae bacterium]